MVVLTDPVEIVAARGVDDVVDTAQLTLDADGPRTFVPIQPTDGCDGRGATICG